MRIPGKVIDIKRTPEMIALQVGDDDLLLGAAVPGAVISGNDEVKRLYPQWH